MCYCSFKSEKNYSFFSLYIYIYKKDEDEANSEMKKKNKETEEEQGAADMVDLLFSCTNVRRENKYFKPEVMVESMP